MWLLRTILFVLLLAGLVYVASQNNDPPGSTVHLFTWTFTEVRLWAVMFAAALVGFAAGLLVSVFREIRLRLDASHVRRELQTKEREINQLRAAPLHDLDSPTTQEPRLPNRVQE